jgi:hypothetical protein
MSVIDASGEGVIGERGFLIRASRTVEVVPGDRDEPGTGFIPSHGGPGGEGAVEEDNLLAEGGCDFAQGEVDADVMEEVSGVRESREDSPGISDRRAPEAKVLSPRFSPSAQWAGEVPRSGKAQGGNRERTVISLGSGRD